MVLADLSCLNSIGGSACPGTLQFGGVIFTGLENYLDGGANCYAAVPGGASDCGLAQQAAGPTPLGISLTCPVTQSCTPEYGIESNGDFFTQASFAGGLLWGAIPTLITQTYKAPQLPETRIGVAYWAFQISIGVLLKTQGYFTARGQDLVFPYIAGTDNGKALATFTLTGDNYFPSTAYGTLTVTGTGTLQAGKKINIADLGQGAQDGFTEYTPGPRWGDYTWAMFVPTTPGSAHGNIYFATEYIQSPNCDYATWSIDPSCGGTRDPYANWGTSVNYLTV